MLAFEDIDVIWILAQYLSLELLVLVYFKLAKANRTDLLLHFAFGKVKLEWGVVLEVETQLYTITHVIWILLVCQLHPCCYILVIFVTLLNLVTLVQIHLYLIILQSLYCKTLWNLLFLLFLNRHLFLVLLVLLLLWFLT